MYYHFSYIPSNGLSSCQWPFSSEFYWIFSLSALSRDLCAKGFLTCTSSPGSSTMQTQSPSIWDVSTLVTQWPSRSADSLSNAGDAHTSLAGHAWFLLSPFIITCLMRRQSVSVALLSLLNTLLWVESNVMIIVGPQWLLGVTGH